MLRLLQSFETGMTRLQAHSTAPGWNDRLLVNCFLTPRMHLELARTHASGAEFVRAFTLATANGGPLYPAHSPLRLPSC